MIASSLPARGRTFEVVVVVDLPVFTIQRICFQSLDGRAGNLSSIHEHSTGIASKQNAVISGVTDRQHHAIGILVSDTEIDRDVVPIGDSWTF